MLDNPNKLKENIDYNTKKKRFIGLIICCVSIKLKEKKTNAIYLFDNKIYR
jgi:hypothetical protein